MEIRSYEEAVAISVKWWSEKAFNTGLNQNNGDDSDSGGMAFMLMNFLSSRAQEKASDENIKKFEEKLTEILLSKKGKNYFANELSVDYNPNKNLADACHYAGIDSMCLPCKTFTYIDPNNAIIGRYQYYGACFKL